jgi:hypothetical protein
LDVLGDALDRACGWGRRRRARAEHHGKVEKGDDAPQRSPTAVDILSPLPDPINAFLSEVGLLGENTIDQPFAGAERSDPSTDSPVEEDRDK